MLGKYITIKYVMIYIRCSDCVGIEWCTNTTLYTSLIYTVYLHTMFGMRTKVMINEGFEKDHELS